MGYYLQQHGIKPSYMPLFSKTKDPIFMCYYEDKLESKLIASPYCHGGLGNKLFQLIAIYSYCLTYNKLFMINMNTYSKDMYTNLDYMTTIFKKIPVSTLTQSTYKKYSEEPQNYSRYVDLVDYKQHSTFLGYFQNEKYFSKHKQEILEMFKIDNGRFNYLTTKYTKYTNSFFLHIRTHRMLKTDGNIDDAFNTHFIDFNSYLDKCLNYINLKDAHFYCFFDDTEKVHKYYSNILDKIPNKTIVVDNELNSLYLMSICKLGGICTNSTFSWWGVYFNQNKGKTIFMPNKWLNNNWPCDIYQKDVIVLPV